MNIHLSKPKIARSLLCKLGVVASRVSPRFSPPKDQRPEGSQEYARCSGARRAEPWRSRLKLLAIFSINSSQTLFPGSNTFPLRAKPRVPWPVALRPYTPTCDRREAPPAAAPGMPVQRRLVPSSLDKPSRSHRCPDSRSAADARGKSSHE